MGKKISTYWAENNAGRAEVHLNAKDECFYIKYFDDKDHLFYTEEFTNNTYGQVCGFAEDWALGYRTLFKTDA